jgi:c(7)-type cytochrome triheme protein
MRPSIALFLILLLVGCTLTPPIAHEEGEEAEPVVLTKAEVLAKLPCFKCHSLEKFQAAPEPGMFAHALHSGFDIHCNQCHEVKGHQPPRIISETCKGCHSLKRIEYEGGGMGKVSFNHEFHSTAFGCADCHPGTFVMKKGAVRMKMDDMYAGRLCGACHDGKSAFSSQDCMRCHKGA